MPMDRRIRLTCSVQYDWSERANAGASFVYSDYRDAEIDSSLLAGEYEKRLFCGN